MPLSLIVLIGVLAAAAGSAVYLFQLDRQRRDLLERVAARPMSGAVGVLTPADASWKARLLEWLREKAPESWSDSKALADKLTQAGYDGATAPVVYTVIRLACAVLPALAVLSFGPHDRPARFIVYLACALALGLLAPPGLVDRAIRLRQLRIRRALPDALDLLVVCVEAGVSLDAALLRVARETELMHPDLARELMVVNRKVNVGMPREAALHGLWTRTGVEELRALASSMIQSERWGTSVATVLRVYAETLRRKRKQAAEKRAAETSVKMLIPLTIFIFPTLFVVILGPAAIDIFKMLGQIKK